MATAPASDPVPLVPSLDRIYSPAAVAKEGARWNELTEAFESIFGKKPGFVARAPGRVNLIGEHIDYVGFSVFPAAIEKDILMAVHVTPASSEDAASTEDSTVRVRLANTTPRFEATTFSSRVDDPSGVTLLHEGAERWANYFKVAFKGLHPHLPRSVLSAPTRPALIEVLVDGTIPPESSLSSSAAMTTCSSIVVLEAFGARELIPRTEMAEVAIESERLVGVNSGGMDQSASIFSIPHHALYISFHPKLTIQPIRLPPSSPEHTFVIANTLIVSDKKVTGPVNYNLRVVETRMAARALAKRLGLPLDASTVTLKGVLETYFQQNALDESEQRVKDAKSKFGEEAARLEFMAAQVDAVFKKEPLDRNEVEQLTGYNGKAFEEEFLSAFPIRADTYKLHLRATHVFSEALRVLAFRSLCISASSTSSTTSSSSSTASDNGASTYGDLGALMDGSQKSLRELYECSCPELDELIGIAKSNGALGSRLTGAGWGGCTVHLLPKPRVPAFIAALREGYYKKHFPELDEHQLKDALFDSQPAGGACVYRVQ